MFKIKMVDIGGDGQLLEFTTTVETLAEAELIAQGEVGGHLGRYDVYLIHDDELVYDVYSDGRSVGFVAIQSL